MPFQISLRIGTDKELSGVDVSGTEMHPITDSELAKFGLTDSVLKEAATLYSTTQLRQPLQGYWLKDPTPGGRFGGSNLFAKEGWTPASVTVTALNATIVSLETEPEIISQKTLANDSDVGSCVRGEHRDSEEDTASKSWSQGECDHISETIDVSVKVFGIGADTSTSFGFSSKWGEGGETTHSHTVS